MKVRELIEALQKVDPEREVVYEECAYGGGGDEIIGGLEILELDSLMAGWSQMPVVRLIRASLLQDELKNVEA
jgi:hypothetical protein